MRKKKTFEYTSYFAAEFNGFLQYRISGGSNGLEELRRRAAPKIRAIPS